MDFIVVVNVKCFNSAVTEYFDKEKMKRLGWIRMHPTTVTREWMEKLGVKKHYVRKDGTNEIIL